MSLICTLVCDKAAILVGETRATKVNDAGTVVGYEEGRHKVHKVSPSAAIGLVGEGSFCDKVLAHARTARGADFRALVQHISTLALTDSPSIPSVANTCVLVAFDRKAGSYQLAIWGSNAKGAQPRVESPNGEIVLHVDGWQKAVDIAHARLDAFLRSTPEVPFGPAGTMREAICDAFSDAAEQCEQVNCRLDFVLLRHPDSPRRSHGSSLFIKNRNAQGKVSRYPSAIRIVYPLDPGAPGSSVNDDDPYFPEITLTLPADPADLFGVEIRDDDDSTVVHQHKDILFPITPNHPALKYVWDNSTSQELTHTFYAYTFNLLGRYSAKHTVNISMPSLDRLAADQVGETDELKWRTAAHSSYKPTSNPLTATDAGATATVNIAAFTMRAAGVDISVNSGNITGLSFGTLYYVYYDDASFAGGSVTFVSTTSKGTALNGDSRWFVGSIRTPVDGGADTVGNNDGGAGAQVGNLYTSYPNDHTTAGTVITPALAYDRDQSTSGYADQNGSGDSTLDVHTYSEIPSSRALSSLKLKVISSSTVVGGTEGVMGIYYSTDDGATFGGTAWQGQTSRSKQLDIVNLSPYLEPSKIQVRAYAGGSGPGDHVKTYLYEARLEGEA